MKETIVIEIRAAEGGDDSKTLVDELLGTYMRVAQRREL
jgi:protein subunit release factor A